MNNTQKKVIYLDACLDDIELAKSDKQLEEIYNRQELFGYFAFHDENFPYSYRYVEKAEYCRNHGFTLQQMLTELQRLHNETTAMRGTAAALLNELKQKENEQYQKSHITQEYATNKQPTPKAKNSKAGIAAIVLILFAAFMLYTGHSIQAQRYLEAERELLEQKYYLAMDEWRKTCEAEQNKTNADIMVTVTNTEISNNHVGSDWYIENYVNDSAIHGRGTIHLTFGDAVTVETYIVEDDSWPDISHGKRSNTFTKDELVNGCSITQDLIVREADGRYAGNAAKWEVRYDFKAIMNYPEEPKREDFAVTKEEVKEYLKNGA